MLQAVAVPGPGRIQRQVRRALIAAGGEPVPFSELRDWCYVGRRPWYWPIHRALKLYGVNVRRGWWQPNDELRRLIRVARQEILPTSPPTPNGPTVAGAKWHSVQVIRVRDCS